MARFPRRRGDDLQRTRPRWRFPQQAPQARGSKKTLPNHTLKENRHDDYQRHQHPPTDPAVQPIRQPIHRQRTEAALAGCCMRCRQSKAERLTALALGYTLADTIRSARGRLTPMASARAAAAAGDWQEAHRITHDALLSALGEAHDAIHEDRNPLYNRALQPVHTLSVHISHATSNLDMAQECLDGDFQPDDEHPEYTAEKHLWNCQLMATPDALSAAARIAETPCTHPASRR